MSKPRSLGELKASGYRPLSVKDELRKNLRCALAKGENPFPGIFGYERTVLPALHNAVLSRQDLLLLGLRHQAKPRILPMLLSLLQQESPATDRSVHLPTGRRHDLRPDRRHRLD